MTKAIDYDKNSVHDKNLERHLPYLSTKDQQELKSHLNPSATNASENVQSGQGAIGGCASAPQVTLQPAHLEIMHLTSIPPPFTGLSQRWGSCVTNQVNPTISKPCRNFSHKIRRNQAEALGRELLATRTVSAIRSSEMSKLCGGNKPPLSDRHQHGLFNDWRTYG